MPNARFGIYIHWPFCQAKCPYCDFNSHVVASVDQARWAAAFEVELDRVAKLTGDQVLRSVFFGGGTPSLMDVSTVERILNRVRKNWRMENDVEITLEANPTSTEADRFKGFKAAGVNRVSIGVQALNDTDLKKLGRLHSAKEALTAIDIARTTFDRMSFDLIYARQHQTVLDWTDELKQALTLEPDHLSLYQLTIEDGTAFGDRFKRGRLAGLPSDDLGADLWDVTQSLTQDAGLSAYEVSNHAQTGEESRHNLIYWNSGSWAGVGPGAHGRMDIDGVRYETAAPKAPGMWLNRIENNHSGDTTFEVLSPQDMLEERILMGLRLVSGIQMPSTWMEEKSSEINGLIEIGLLQRSGSVLRATSSGRPLLNGVINQLLAS